MLGCAKHYYSRALLLFPACITHAINSKYYGNPYYYIYLSMFTLTGKYPHLVASVGGKSPATTELSLSFGDVPIGQSAVKWVHITNVSPVSKLF